MAQDVHNTIVDGPSKCDLMIAFFDKVDGKRRPVSFTVDGPDFPRQATIHVVINKLGWEDGSGHSWNFKGYVTTDGKTVRGWFRTGAPRDGWIIISS